MELKYTLTPLAKEDVWGLHQFTCGQCGHEWRRRMRKLGNSWHAVIKGGGPDMEYPYRCPSCGTTDWF